MKAEYYADEYRKYTTFISDWENSGGLTKIASGASDADVGVIHKFSLVCFCGEGYSLDKCPILQRT